MRCVRCGEENREGRKFCAGCGAELGWDCRVCGFGNEARESFCGGCGRPRTDAMPAPGGVSITSKDPEAAGERRYVAILFADL